MINHKCNLQTNGCGNGTLCKFKGIKSKNGEKPFIKNVNGYKVNAVVSDSIGSLICESWDDSSGYLQLK